jgi:hypothetical protein
MGGHGLDLSNLGLESVGSSCGYFDESLDSIHCKGILWLGVDLLASQEAVCFEGFMC